MYMCLCMCLNLVSLFGSFEKWFYDVIFLYFVLFDWNPYFVFAVRLCVCFWYLKKSNKKIEIIKSCLYEWMLHESCFVCVYYYFTCFLWKWIHTYVAYFFRVVLTLISYEMSWFMTKWRGQHHQNESESLDYLLNEWNSWCDIRLFFLSINIFLRFVVSISDVLNWM